LVTAKDLQIPRCVETADEAVAIVREHRALWLAAQAAGR
jgi:hypothetical protein